MADFNWDDAKTGAFTGAGTGALAGTAIMPGVGTVVGGVGGALIGGMIGGGGGFGGGLFDTLSGRSDPDERFGVGGIKGTEKQMAQNEGVLQQWAYNPGGRKDQYGNFLPGQGPAPSAAQDLLSRNRSEGQGRALSNAKSMAGGNPALAAQLANRQQTQVSADSGFQSATLRAQEQQNAMSAYQAAMERRRQQNIDIAKAQSDADQKNAEKGAGFIGSTLSNIGGGMGGMLG